MSIQTDCEILAVRAMEAYAKKHGLCGNAVVEVFHIYDDPFVTIKGMGVSLVIAGETEQVLCISISV